MGRHARGAARSRVPVAAAVLGVLVLGIIVVGSWLGSRLDPVAADDSVNASAVVVSSVPCAVAPGPTLVDVVTPDDSAAAGNPARATLEACGYQEGQQVPVQYRASDPGDITLRNADAAPSATGGLLPLGLAVAGLLAVGASLAVYADNRARPARRRHAAGADVELSAAETPAVDLPPPGAVSAPSDRTDPTGGHRPTGSEPAPDGGVRVSLVPAEPGRHAVASAGGAAPTASPWNSLSADALQMQYPDVTGHGPFTAAQARATSAGDADAAISAGDRAGSGPEQMPFPGAAQETGGVRREMSSVDLIFPYSSTLAASLHDELFTHRSVSG